MSHISAQGEQSTSAEILALTNITALGNGILQKTGTSTFEIASGVGTGDVVGPSSAVDGAIAVFNTTTGKLLKEMNATIEISGGDTTLVIGGTMPGKIKMKDSSGSGWTYITTLNGVLTSSDTP